MWSEVEREVNKQPHNTLASLKAMISDVMAKLDRDVAFMYARGSGLVLRLIWRPLGFLSNKCTWYMNTYKLFLKVSSKSINSNYFFY
jgi:hypothetical protein